MTHFSSYSHDRGEANPRTNDGRPTRSRTPDISGEVTPEGRCQEFSLTLKPHADESLFDMFHRLDRALKELGATVLKLMIYGPVTVAAPATEAMERAFGKVNWPVTWVEGGVCDRSPIAGVQVFAFNGRKVGRLTLDGRVVGSVYDDGDARFCLMGGLGPDEIAGTRADQTERTLDQMQTVLVQGGFALGDVVRTWFFLDDLLSWYDAFNEVRTRVYSQTKFRSGFLPASTGVAGRNPAGTALAVSARAMQPLSSASRAEEVYSPLQCPAPEYGSSFSRAIEINSAGLRRLFISGTASIGPDGRTLHAGDVRPQIGLSMEVVEAILKSRRMSFADVTRATAYFQSPDDAPAFAAWCDQRESPKLRVISAGCDICRAELLFEIELDAVTPAIGGSL